jgi:hypothetical protein
VGAVAQRISNRDALTMSVTVQYRMLVCVAVLSTASSRRNGCGRRDVGMGAETLQIDYIYGLPALESGDGYTNAQGERVPYAVARLCSSECCTPLTRLALMNLLEAMLNVEYLYLRHTSSRTTRSTTMSRDYGYHGHAPIVGFATVTMTWSKTALYFIQGEQACIEV